MNTQETSPAPADAVVRQSQSIEMDLDPSDAVYLRLVVQPLRNGNWNWSVWDRESQLTLAEDAGQCGTEALAKMAARGSALRLLRRAVNKLDAEVDAIEEAEDEWC